MRLINTTTLCLSQDFFGSQIPETYSILSHRWREEEPTFRDFETDHPFLHEKKGYRKIEAAARVAKERGYEWIWVDTVCIDKTSSAELSESINSIFKWYKKADFCFAYLDDVEVIEDLGNSKWFKRGWTLQELLAPDKLLFFNQNWEPLETKWLLAGQLHQITGISVKILRHELGISETCAATRMAWASQRNTTREEDNAYCLLGIFGVNMPLLYGEGAQAFIRLQEVILQSTGDTSLLAWNPLDESSETDTGKLERELLRDPSNYIPALAPSTRHFHHYLTYQPYGSSSSPCSARTNAVRVMVVLKNEGGVKSCEFVAMLRCCVDLQNSNHEDHWAGLVMEEEALNPQFYQVSVQLVRIGEGAFLRRKSVAQYRPLVADGRNTVATVFQDLPRRIKPVATIRGTLLVLMSSVMGSNFVVVFILSGSSWISWLAVWLNLFFVIASFKQDENAHYSYGILIRAMTVTFAPGWLLATPIFITPTTGRVFWHGLYISNSSASIDVIDSYINTNFTK